MKVENWSLEDEFSLQKDHFPLPGVLEREYHQPSKPEASNPKNPSGPRCFPPNMWCNIPGFHLRQKKIHIKNWLLPWFLGKFFSWTEYFNFWNHGNLRLYERIMGWGLFFGLISWAEYTICKVSRMEPENDGTSKFGISFSRGINTLHKMGPPKPTIFVDLSLVIPIYNHG